MSISASRKPDPKHYREHLRVLFVWHLIRNQKFEKLANDFQPLWSRALESAYDPMPLTQRLFAALPQGDRSLMAYRAAISASVMEELGCQDGGHAAEWVCQALHGAVSDGLVALVPEVDTQYLYGDLRIPVFSVGSAAVGMLINGKGFGDSVDLEAPEVGEGDLEGFISPALSAFSAWGELRKKAHAQLDILINEMRVRTEAETQSWKAVYRKGHQTRVYQTMPLLVSWLVDRESLWAGDRPAGHALLRELGLDQPDRVEKSLKNK